MKLIACDEHKDVLDQLITYSNKYNREYGKSEKINIITFNNKEKFLYYYEDNKDIDIIFLDIEFSKGNGIQAASIIRKMDEQVPIIFLTEIIKYVLKGYEVNASNYLLKPLAYKTFEKEINKIIRKNRLANNNYIIEKNIHSIYKLYLKDIVYIETYDRITLIHTTSTNIKSTKSMKSHEQSLSSDFFRCHEGIIVNMIYIIRIDGLKITLLTGQELPVSRRRRKELLEHLSTYLKTSY